MIRDSLKIELLHYTKCGREVSYSDLVCKVDHLEDDELEPVSIWGAIGGLVVVADGYQIIYRDFEFYVLLKAVDFLMHSLCWLSNNPEGWFDKDEEFPHCILARFVNGNYLRLQRVGEATVSLSYQPAVKDQVHDRRARFFLDEQFSFETWQDACFEGLRDFFRFIDPYIKRKPDNPQARILAGYQRFWIEQLSC